MAAQQAVGENALEPCMQYASEWRTLHAATKLRIDTPLRQTASGTLNLDTLQKDQNAARLHGSLLA